MSRHETCRVYGVGCPPAPVPPRVVLSDHREAWGMIVWALVAVAGYHAARRRWALVCADEGRRIDQ